jgi:DNA adenine methylase
MVATAHFVGSKGGAGIAQWLISLMPAHRVYVEPFLGRGVVMLTKKLAAVSVGIDCDAGTIADYIRRHYEPTETMVHGDALTLLPLFSMGPDWFVYADPPYLGSTRSCKRAYYRHELFTEAEHERLLSVLTGLQAKVMISGYQSPLYSMRLSGWRTASFWTVNRRGKRVQEFVWMNYPAGRLHDSRFVGNGFTDRQRIKRKAGRWQRKFLAMPADERQAVLDSLLNARDPLAVSDSAYRQADFGCAGSQSRA